MNTNTMDARIKELMALGATFAEAHAAALAEAELDAKLNRKGGRKPTGKPAPAEAKPELVEFVKKDGTVKMVSPKQAAVWEAARNRDRMSLDEVKALKPEITEAGRAYVKAHPGCTRKEAAANGCKNITKDGLKALKRELGVR